MVQGGRSYVFGLLCQLKTANHDSPLEVGTVQWPRFPILYEINTWPWLMDVSRRYGCEPSLDRLPDAELKRLADWGFDGVWLMGVWQRSPAGRALARAIPELQQEYQQALPGWTEPDVVGSPYAVAGYELDTDLGSSEALAGLHRRLHSHGLRLILDFVPNHLAVDHPWVTEKPHRFVQGSEQSWHNGSGHWFQTASGHILAHGRDPFFDPWTDTAQLDYRRLETRQAMKECLLSIAEVCDGVRCDMAMLVMHRIFSWTWGGVFERPEQDFWPEAIRAVKDRFPGFLMVAEAYWDTEYELQQQGFDYVYDKRLYDRMVGRDPAPVRDHVRLADPAYQAGLLRFLENHDEQRLAALLDRNRSQAAAVAAMSLPGARLLHQGQMRGARRRLPVQLGRGPEEPGDDELEQFYRRLLGCLHQAAFHRGSWRFLEPAAVSPDDQGPERVLSWVWELEGEIWLIAVNTGQAPLSCLFRLQLGRPSGSQWHMAPMLGNGYLFMQDGATGEPAVRVDLAGWDYRLLRLTDQG